MHKKKWTIFVVGIIFVVCAVIGLKLLPKSSSKVQTSTANNQPTFLLEGFPIDTVPLYKVNKVSSSKIFVNTDPKNTSTFNAHNYAYFNVVLYSDASQEEFLNYYKSIFDRQITEAYDNPEMVKGEIGPYKVSAAHYGSDNTGYIQVHVPQYNDERIQTYFLDFPQIVGVNARLVEHEKSYGLLNQKGGEIEYTKYFTVIDSGDANKDGKDDEDEFFILEKGYIEQFMGKPEYSYDEKTGIMKWHDGDFESTLSISRNHGRIYLMLRKKM